jgi:tetratricopeptide (TPR) repeat protein
LYTRDETPEPASASAIGSSDTIEAEAVPAGDAPVDGPTTLGRYRIERRLGEGGMGVVYAARDPELGRTVAIKRVREKLAVGSGLRDRLRREAQALARLSHPNVVSAYDVGVDDGQLFIVMQYVDGVVLDTWLKERRPDAAGVLRLFVQAGRGLAAAHAAGLVHRDFKPSNVLVESDGTVRVTDFGLARLSDLSEATTASGEIADPLGASMTRGDLVGTPAYMAPEQFLGGPITGAADQFGFCVALWEALTGARPFPGKDLDALRASVVAGVIAPERARGLPRRLERVLRRGLMGSPHERYGDMNELLDELAPTRRVRWLVGAALVAGGAAAAIPLMFARDAAGENPCASSAAELDRLWTPAVRTELYAAFATLSLPDAPALAEALVSKLDARAATWRVMQLDTCEASRVRRTEDADVAARRTACLTRSLEGLRAAIELARSADDPTKANALAATRAGTDPTECSATGTLRGWTSTVTSGLSQRLAEVEAAEAVGATRVVLEKARPLAVELEAAGDLQGAARAYLALVATAGNQANKTAREDARKAAVLASRAGEDALEAVAWRWAAAEASTGLADGSVEELLAMAEAAASRSGKAAEERLWIAITRGRQAIKERAYDKGIEACRRALDDARATPGGSSPIEISALGCLYSGYYHAERWSEAMRVSQERLAKVRAREGESSTLTLECMRQAALATFWGGKPEEGRAAMHETIARTAAVVGAESLHVMESWWRLAQAETHDGEVASTAGLEASQRATELATKLLGPDSLRRATIFMTHGDILGANGKHEEALVAYERVLEVYDRVDNPKKWAPVAYNVADGYMRARRCDKARPIIDRIIAFASAGRVGGSLGPTAVGLRGMCGVQTGELAAGIKDLDEAIAQCDRLEEHSFAAQFRIGVAEAHRTGRDPAAAERRLREVLQRVPDDKDAEHRALRAQATKLLAP